MFRLPITFLRKTGSRSRRLSARRRSLQARSSRWQSARQVERADSLNRCMTNISAFFDLADLGKSLGYDLWSGEESSGCKAHMVDRPALTPSG